MIRNSLLTNIYIINNKKKSILNLSRYLESFEHNLNSNIFNYEDIRPGTRSPYGSFDREYYGRSITPGYDDIHIDEVFYMIKSFTRLLPQYSRSQIDATLDHVHNFVNEQLPDTKYYRRRIGGN